MQKLISFILLFKCTLINKQIDKYWDFYIYTDNVMMEWNKTLNSKGIHPQCINQVLHDQNVFTFANPHQELGIKRTLCGIRKVWNIIYHYYSSTRWLYSWKDKFGINLWWHTCITGVYTWGIIHVTVNYFP